MLLIDKLLLGIQKVVVEVDMVRTSWHGTDSADLLYLSYADQLARFWSC